MSTYIRLGKCGIDFKSVKDVYSEKQLREIKE